MLEIGELKERVARIEQAARPESNAPRSNLEAVLKIQGEGYENLASLYNSGYHVCPMAYGELRMEECLFCAAFLAKE